MSERYGAPGELNEVLYGLESWVREEMRKLTTSLRFGPQAGTQYDLGRVMALRDVLSYLGVDSE